ncbi:ATP dependent RNA helicase [Marichromatium bheemlicum]|uniref:ATP dependent RNA helicase n=1 Tax=Marichromatium bheemlicum TaxID=365339 RepID=A0ABX1I496_9GAMM|nr:ATP dependent RNA helicase [Marichromatium bheemlicum]NKN31906.1 ATP dependent RNA helicase [Marichromatium bheemlicum]
MQEITDQLTAQDLSRLTPSELESRLRELIRRYAREGSSTQARAVIQHIEALYLHPAGCRDPDQQCHLRRFARHWRWLATHRTRALAPGH